MKTRPNAKPRSPVVAALLLALLFSACGTATSEAPTPTQSPSATPTVRVTPTAVAPRPVVAYTPVSPDTLAPILLERTPKRGQRLPSEGAIQLVFDRPMDREAVAKALRVNRAGTSQDVAGTLVWADDRTVTFSPTRTLPRDETFDVILTQDARAQTGEPLRQPYAFRFSTVGSLDVTQVIPAPGTVDVETDAAISVMFSRPVVPLTTVEEMAQLPDPLSIEPAIEGSGEWVSTSIYVFKPNEPLAGGSTYNVTVSGELQDLGGVPLRGPYTWQFTTVPPGVLRTDPWDSASLVDINTTIGVAFNQPIDEASAAQSFSLRTAGVLGSSVRGTVEVNGAAFTFTPAEPLAFDTRYIATVDAGVTSTTGGHGMTSAHEWSFTTVPLPRIVETYPGDGDRNARSYTEFRIIFNAPINPTTVMPNLSMTPPLSATQVHTYYSQYNSTFVLHFGAQPSTDYSVDIATGIADPYGNTIPRGRTVRFSTAALPPSYQLLTPDFVGTYDAALPARLVVSHVNLERLNLRLYQLPSDVLKEESWRWQERDRDLPTSALLRDWRETLSSPLNQQARTAIQLTEAADGLLAPGVYLLDAMAPEMGRDEWRSVQRHILAVSELNLTLKTAPEELIVWAVDLATGDPVAGLELTIAEVYEGREHAVTTDGEGIGRLEVPNDARNWMVISESPFAAVGSGWGRGISRWEFGLGEGVPAQGYRAYLYTDREIYRPEQTVHFKGVIRSDDDAEYSLPGLQTVDIEIRDTTGEILLSDAFLVSENGTFSGATELVADAALGEYVISASFADQQSWALFTVAAYRPPEFEITVSSETPEIQRGEDLQASIEVSYFFGGPLGDTSVTWTLLAEPATFQPPWGGQYSFSDNDDPYHCFYCWWYEPPTPETLLTGAGVTDSQGRLRVTVSASELADVLPKGTQRVYFEASARGPDNQEISGRTSLTVHPGPYYIGLQARAYVSRAGEETDIDLVVVDWKGERLADREIAVRFYRREWINTFVENDVGGGRWSWEAQETWIGETIATTDELGEAVASFLPADGGSYHVVAAPADPSPETETIRSSIYIWVSGTETVLWRRENHDRITLVSDKSTYRVGETAEILIPSPLPSPQLALITIEREGVRRYDVLRLQSNSTIYRLPIETGDIPNIYVSVVLLSARRDGPAEFKMGLLPIDVNPEPKTLSVEVAASSKQAQPGESITYTISVVHDTGLPAAGAELSLDVVDKAVLSLKPRTKSITGALYARRQLQVTTASGLSISVNRFQEELDIAAVDTDEELAFADDLDLGQGGAIEAPAAMPTGTAVPEVAREAEGIRAPSSSLEIRESFADTASWTPTLVTDGDGRVSVSVTLPDNLTTWTARAVAVNSQTQVGEGTTDVMASKPLLVRPVTPRFFVVDDRAQLAANVTNNTAASLDVDVGLRGGGLLIAPETPAEQIVTIPPRAETKVTWWVTVDDTPQVDVVFTASAGEFSDASRPRLATGPDGTLLVLRYTAPDTVGTAGQLIEGGARTEAIALPPSFDDSRGHLTVHLDPSLAAAMREGLDYLEHYEYECTEQTVSRFLPNVLTYRALTSLGLEDPELESRLTGLIEEGLTKLTNQQNSDGGWGWWYRPTEGESNPYVSAYVVFALDKAREAGFAAPQAVLSNGIGYLQSQIKDVRDLETYWDANRQAWLLYALAETAAVAPSDVDLLFESRERLSHYARAYLAQAIWLGNPQDTRLETLLSDLNNAAILSATGTHWEESHDDWWAMNTDTRSTAIILDALAKLDPGNALIPNVIRWLMVARQFGIWETTQETAWALIALTDWMVETGELEASYDFGLYLNDVERATGSVTPKTVDEGIREAVPVTDLEPNTTNALTVARTEGTGRLYYTAHLQIYLPVEDLKAEDRGFVVQRRYTLASCDAADRRECPEVSEANLGDVIRVDLTLISPHDRYYVVVEDPLPAGGEAIDAGLATTSLAALDPSLEPTDARYWWWWRWYSRSELRDEKVVLFADYLSAGTYEYTYTFRATLPGDYHVIPTTVREFYFPEVFGRSNGRLLTIVQ